VSADALGIVRLAICAIGLFFLGLGAWMWWEPAGFMVTGLALIALAVFGEIASHRTRPVVPPPVAGDDE